MKDKLASPEYLIAESMNFIKLNYKYYDFHIVSGSEHNELNFLCNKLRIKKYFYSISGSPTPKEELIKNLMNRMSYKKKETILIGDSVNDYEAAKANKIKFYGYNNPSLESMSNEYILDFDNFRF